MVFHIHTSGRFCANIPTNCCGLGWQPLASSPEPSSCALCSTWRKQDIYLTKIFLKKKSTGDKGVMKDEIKMSDLGVGHPLITWLAWLSEAQTGAITWTTQDNKHPHMIWRKIYSKRENKILYSTLPKMTPCNE